MKNYNQICKEVACDVKHEMQTAIEFGYDSFNYEKEYGTAIVIVEMYQRYVSNYYMTFVDVVVAHEDAHHQSPRLTNAIKKSLPDFDTMQRNYERNLPECDYVEQLSPRMYFQ